MHNMCDSIGFIRSKYLIHPNKIFNGQKYLDMYMEDGQT